MTEWPEPVERVAAVLRGAAVDARIEQFGEGAATARDAARVIGCGSLRSSSRWSRLRRRLRLALVPGDRRADERDRRGAGASTVRVANAAR
jgi:hypothetical protein